MKASRTNGSTAGVALGGAGCGRQGTTTTRFRVGKLPLVPGGSGCQGLYGIGSQPALLGAGLPYDPNTSPLVVRSNSDGLTLPLEKY